jgi:hypothetical protein
VIERYDYEITDGDPQAVEDSIAETVEEEA